MEGKRVLSSHQACRRPGWRADDAGAGGRAGMAGDGGAGTWGRAGAAEDDGRQRGDCGRGGGELGSGSLGSPPAS